MMKVLVAGDFCPQNRVAELFSEQKYQIVLGQMQESISNVDYALVNFECPIMSGDKNAINKNGPNLYCLKEGLEAVKWVGFDCVTLANNHFYDYGDDGVRNTLLACDSYGLEHVGGGYNIFEASKILYKRIKGSILAIINCCEHEFSIATNTSPGSNPLNPIQQYYQIHEARDNADYVLVIVHGGHEHFQLPSPRMQDTYRFFIDAGASAVINHHQHCYSGYEVYNGKPIFYGLGNFCFDDPGEIETNWNYGYCVELGFEGADVQFKYKPYKQCSLAPTVEPIQNNIIDNKLQKINTILLNKQYLIKEVEKYYNDKMFNIRSVFEPFNNRFILGAQRRGWIPSFISKKNVNMLKNFIECESHRDRVIHYFNKMYKI